MFSTESTEESDRTIKFDGIIYYYKHGWLSNKWMKIYAKLWSDSTLEWFENKDSDKPIGSMLLNSVIPYFCIGPRIKNVPTIKPKIKASWDKNLLMAIATDIQASTVHWFYFVETENFRKWIHEITETFPRIIVPLQNCSTKDVSNNDYEETDSLDPFSTNQSSEEPNSSPQSLKKQSSFNSLFNETYSNYGLGEFFFPMTVDSSDYESEIDSENDGDKEDYIYSKNAKTCDDRSHLNIAKIVSILK